MSPLWYKWVDRALRKYYLIPSRSPRLIGLSLYRPIHDELNSRALVVNNDHQPFLFQSPCSWGAVYFPGPWRYAAPDFGSRLQQMPHTCTICSVSLSEAGGPEPRAGALEGDPGRGRWGVPTRTGHAIRGYTGHPRNQVLADDMVLLRDTGAHYPISPGCVCDRAPSEAVAWEGQIRARPVHSKLFFRGVGAWVAAAA